jgi:aryl-alcohol dehydrogenase-like predicted oxidoreductase
LPTSEALLARFVERGGNFIDTANGYTKGNSKRSSATSSRAPAAAIAP